MLMLLPKPKKVRILSYLEPTHNEEFKTWISSSFPSGIFKFNILNGGKIELGDLVYCLRGATFGKTAIVDPYKEGAIASSLTIVRPFAPCLNLYLYRYLVNPVGRSQIFRFDNGSAQPNLSANSVKLYVYPLPSLAEQCRIVEKIDRLMGLCDRLEESIESGKCKQTDLLNALMSQV
jgi:type I restriction enzyme, S subunit